MEIDAKTIIEIAGAILVLGGTFYAVRENTVRSKSNEKALVGLMTDVSTLRTTVELMRDDIKELKADIKSFFHYRSNE